MDLSVCNVLQVNSKTCYRCHGIYSLGDFSVDESKMDGRSIYCSSCRRKILKKRRSMPQFNAKRRSKRHRYAESNRNWRLKTKYGITLEQFEQLFAIQNRRCALCKSTKSDKNNFVVDHCHKTGKIRGILCSYCNRALGMFKDDACILLKAIEYLKGDF